MRHPVRSTAVRRQRGLSLVELMVGVAVGLFVVAAAAMLLSIHLGENRRLSLEAQVQQDLRVAADIVARELRRAGHWDAAASAIMPAGAPVPVNPYAPITPDQSASTQVDFAYWRREGDAGPWGFKLEAQVLKMRLASGGWQELTDGHVLRVTAFTVTPRPGQTTTLPCPRPCADGTTACWPTLTVRELAVDIAGHAAADPTVRRALRTVVRPRNDLVRFAAAGTPAPACPA